MAPVGAFGVEQLLGAFGAGAFGGGERGDGVELGVVLRRGRSRGPENLARGCGLLPGAGRCRSVARARRPVRARRPGAGPRQGGLIPASRGGPGWEGGGGLPVMPASLWDRSPYQSLVAGT